MVGCINVILSKGGKGLGLLIALVLLNATSYVDVLTSLSVDKPAGYYNASTNVMAGSRCEMIADNTIQFSNSEPDTHHRTYTLNHQCSAAVLQLAITVHCGTLFLFSDYASLAIHSPQCPRVCNNSPPTQVGC